MKKILGISIIATVLGSSIALAEGPDGGAGGREARHAKHFEKLDQNGDGKLTRDEFSAARAAHFDELDANRDGKLTPEERKAAWDAHRAKRASNREKGQRAMHPHPEGKRGHGHFGRDETVTRAEMLKRGAERFDELDANHDGVVQREEMAQAHAQRKHRRGRGHGRGHDTK